MMESANGTPGGSGGVSAGAGPESGFQDLYRRRQEHGHGRWGVRRSFNLTLGILIWP